MELRTKQITSLNEMGSLLECSGAVKDACSVVADSVEKLFPEAHSGALYLFRSSRNLIEAAVRWGRIGTSESTFLPDACWSLRRGQPHWSEHPGSGISCQHLTKSSTTECLCVPMVARGNTLGVLHLEFESVAEARLILARRLFGALANNWPLARHPRLPFRWLACSYARPFVNSRFGIRSLACSTGAFWRSHSRGNWNWPAAKGRPLPFFSSTSTTSRNSMMSLAMMQGTSCSSPSPIYF